MLFFGKRILAGMKCGSLFLRKTMKKNNEFHMFLSI
jgi:hypothetical protein